MKKNNITGVDFSDSSIKVVHMGADREVTAYGSAVLREGIIADGVIIDREAFSTALNDIFKTTRPNVLRSDKEMVRTVISVPESKLFTHYVKLPPALRKDEVEEYVRIDAESIIPFNLADMYWDYHVTDATTDRGAVFAGVRKDIIDNYVDAFSRAGARPIFIVCELFSLGHALVNNLPPGDFIVVDIGARTATVGVLDADAIPHLSVKVPCGGKRLTADLSRTLQISDDEAEQLKKEHGLVPGKGSKGVAESLATSLKDIVTEIGTARSHFEKTTGRTITHVVLLGGTALLPGIADHIGKCTGLTTRVADPFASVKKADILDAQTPAILYTNVLGLALCGAGEYSPSINLLTQYRYDDSDDEKMHLKITEVRSLQDLAYVARMVAHDALGLVERVRALVAPKYHIDMKLVFSICAFITAIGLFIVVLLRYT